MNNYSITEAVSTTYKLRTPPGTPWADITIIPATEGDGFRLTIASDFGDWQNYWAAPSKSIPAFLKSLEKDYTATKFGCDKVFDLETSIKALKDSIAEREKDQERPPSNKDSDLMAGLFDRAIREAYDVHEYARDFMDIGYLRFYFDTPLIYYKTNPLFERFWQEIWPTFIKHINQ